MNCAVLNSLNFAIIFSILNALNDACFHCYTNAIINSIEKEKMRNYGIIIVPIHISIAPPKLSQAKVNRFL